MDVQSNNFVALADIAIHKPELQKAVSMGTANAYYKREAAMFADGQEHGQQLRVQAAEAKRRALRKLPDLLELAEKNMKANGMEVLWAANAFEANKFVMDIVKRHNVKTVTKSKSMLTEEIGLNHVLEEADVRVVETDLGEYIIQINNETPSHIIAPVIHKTKEEIRDIFIEKLNMPPTDDAGEMVAFARKMLRADFLASDIRYDWLGDE
jgi:L-lactate dehydrogenase complex protein LldF